MERMGSGGGGKKAFVSHVNTHLGKLICRRLVEAEYEVTGTSGGLDGKSTRDAKVVQVEDAVVLRKSVIDADLVVYQLEDGIETATSILKVLRNGQYDTEKTFILVSSTATWFETAAAAKAEQEEAQEDDQEEEEEEETPEELPTYSEEEYTKRVPHVKYQLWKEVEKLCKKAASATLHTYCIFAGLQYGNGEDKLQPIFKQAWHLTPQGLPVFGLGTNTVPMVHVADLATLVLKLATMDAPMEQRYFFGVDEGSNTWKDIITAVNTTMGNGRTFTVPEQDYILYENVEQFTINLKLEIGKMGEILEEEDWACRGGFVEGAARVIQEFKKECGVEPLRVVMLGPPASGKSYLSRELSSHYKVPCYTAHDVIEDYSGQVVEFEAELHRLQVARKEGKLREQLAELRAKKKEEAAEVEGEEGEDKEEEEKTKIEDEDEIFDDDLLKELEASKEGEEGEEEEEDDEAMAELKQQIEQVKRVMALKEKPTKQDEAEPAHPKDKKKPDPKKGKKDEPAPEQDTLSRYSDRCLAYMMQWKLRQPQCRNQGYILDGYPKTVKQARLLFEESMPGELPDPEEEEEPLPAEMQPMDDTLYPDYILQLKASDTFLTERIQKISGHHPHNNPADFQRRLECYKVNNPSRCVVIFWGKKREKKKRERHEPGKDASKGLSAFLDAATTSSETGSREAAYRQFDVEGCPLVPPPPPASKYEKRPVDKVVEVMVEFVGGARNFGPSPAAIAEEQERVENLAKEQKEVKAREEEDKKKAAGQELLQQQAVALNEQKRIAEIKEQERAMLEARKEPLKQYLMENIIPTLTKGIIEVCEQRPDDPVDYLADWLFRHNPVDDDTGI